MAWFASMAEAAAARVNAKPPLTMDEFLSAFRWYRRLRQIDRINLLTIRVDVYKARAARYHELYAEAEMFAIYQRHPVPKLEIDQDEYNRLVEFLDKWENMHLPNPYKFNNMARPIWGSISAVDRLEFYQGGFLIPVVNEKDE